MKDMLADIVLAGCVGLSLLMLLEACVRHRHVSRGLRTLLLLGALILAVAGAMRVLGQVIPGANEFVFYQPEIQLWIERAGIGLGAVLISIVVLRLLSKPGATTGNHTRRALHDGDQHSQIGRIDEELRGTRELLNRILKCSPSGIMVLAAVRNEDGDVVDFECRLSNAAASNILGISASDLHGGSILDRLPCLRGEGLFDDAVSVIETGLPLRDERLMTHGRIPRWYQVVAAKLDDGLAVTFSDVSTRKRGEEQLRFAAEHDTLTGLPNRSLLIRRVEQALTRSSRMPDYRFALLFLDFDRFKIINDSLGHEIGDELLISIAERLRLNLRTLDTASRAADGHLPARLGGDEFVILLDGVAGEKDVVAVAERLQRELAMPHLLAGHEVISTASIGIVINDGRYASADDMIRDADTAMYRAKLDGKARHVVFDEQMHKNVVDRLNLETDLREAVESKAFDLKFEPIVGLDDGRIQGFEALIRWNHPQRGNVPPLEFIGLAEEIGLIVPLGDWVLRRAARAVQRIAKRCPGYERLIVNVNLSKRQLHHPGFVESADRIFREFSIDPKRIGLEITESMIMSDSRRLTEALDEFRRMGCSIVMDDFGTGQSSLSCLHRFPIDVLKIDRSFILSASRKRDYAAIVNAVVILANNLQMRVVAEGVENYDQLTMLQGLDCNFGQGRLFGDPLSEDEVVALLQDDHSFRIAA